VLQVLPSSSCKNPGSKVAVTGFRSNITLVGKGATLFWCNGGVLDPHAEGERSLRLPLPRGPPGRAPPPRTPPPHSSVALARSLRPPHLALILIVSLLVSLQAAPR
jgi:hypothetical protein